MYTFARKSKTDKRAASANSTRAGKAWSRQATDRATGSVTAVISGPYGDGARLKLEVGSPNDAFGKKAEGMAKQDVGMSESNVLRQCPQCEVKLQQKPVEENGLQKRTLAGQRIPLVQRRVKIENKELIQRCQLYHPPPRRPNRQGQLRTPPQPVAAQGAEAGAIHHARTVLGALRVRPHRWCNKPDTHFDLTIADINSLRPTAALVAAGWNRAADDLGSRGPYHTIFHFARRLNRLARTTIPGATNYHQARGLMPEARLAGFSARVHPRALYFVAAAQAGMDREAGFGPGEGHYIAPSAMYREVVDIVGIARDFINQSDFGGARQVYMSLRNRLQHIERTVNRQIIAQRTGDPREQYEVELCRRLHGHLGAFRQMPGNVASDADAVTLMRRIASNGPGAPGGEDRLGIGDHADAWRRRQPTSHGGGTLGDYHGTAHAMGLAWDHGTGRGQGRTMTNMPFLSSTYIPFVNYLIQCHGASTNLGGVVVGRRYSDLPGDQLRTLSALLRSGQAEALFNQIRAAAEYWRIVLECHQLFNRCYGTVNNLSNNRRISQSVRIAATTAKRGLEAGRDLTRHARQNPPVPTDLLEVIGNTRRELQNLVGEVDSTGASIPPVLMRQVNERLRPVLSNLGGIPVRITAGILTVYSTELGRECAALFRRQPRPFRMWFNTVHDGSLDLFDQPAIFQAGVTSVRGTQFQGVHHFEMGVGPRRQTTYILQGPNGGRDNYVNTLLEDMRQRNLEDMRRILSVMAEHEQGRNMLEGPTADPLFRQALDGWARRASGVNVDNLLNSVVTDVPVSSQSPQADRFVSALVQSGHHELAREVARVRSP